MEHFNGLPIASRLQWTLDSHIAVDLHLHPLDDDVDRDDVSHLRSMRNISIGIIARHNIGESVVDNVDGMVNMLECPCCVHQWK